MEGEYVIDSAKPIDVCFAEMNQIIASSQSGQGI